MTVAESDRPRGWVEGADELRLRRRPPTWDGVLEHAERVLAVAKREAPFSSRWVLFSGGNDSIVLLHALHFQLGWPLDGVLHVNTGTGVFETDADGVKHFITSEFARDVVEDWGLKFVERTPPSSYDEVFIDDPIIDGLPGPGLHNIAYARLKERAIAAHVQDVKRSYWDRVILATGVRHDESARRMGYGGTLVNRERAQVWCNPIYYATKPMMAAYRQEHDLPINPVWAHLHMSGECLCGSFASPGELDQISFFYPETGEWLRERERRAKAAGLTYWTWGMKRPDHDVIDAAYKDGRITDADLWPAMDLCQACDTRRQAIDKAYGRLSLFEQEVAIR